jgi:adenylate kinase
MNIFLAGIHGVGKTFLASQLPPTLNLVHTSASKLIKEERQLPNWGVDKRVSNIDTNQIALASAVRRHNNENTGLLLDGHFVLINEHGDFSPLAAEVFKSLNLQSVILLEADAHIVADRIYERDGRKVDIHHLLEFINVERSQAQLVCDELGIPLTLLNSPNIQTFSDAVSSGLQR